MSERLTTKEAAELLGVHPVTMRKWRAKSEIKVVSSQAVLEDCNGLIWRLESPRLVSYDGSTVRRLKELLDRRKQK